MYDRILMAGLGAYARYEKLGREGKELFEELVTDGESVRERAGEKINETREDVKERVNTILTRVKGKIDPESDKDACIAELSKQIDELSQVVKTLTEAKKLHRPSGLRASVRLPCQESCGSVKSDY